MMPVCMKFSDMLREIKEYSDYIFIIAGASARDAEKHRLKVKNLGNKAIPILEKELQFFKNKEFRFITCKDLYLTKK